MSNPDMSDGLPLDPSLYSPTEAEVEILKKLTGIEDEEDLKRHAIEVQTEAYSVFPYGCIRYFGFLTFKVTRYPIYKEILRLGKERPKALFLDLGCGFGNDIRKLTLDGYPLGNVIGADLHKEFWDIGHKLFKTTPETYPVTFLQGDIFDPTFFSPGIPSDLPQLHPPLASLTSLSPLKRQVSIIHTGAFFHLFPFDKQRELGQLLSDLLLPLPGSIVAGAHLGLPDDEERKDGVIITQQGRRTFPSSPKTWNESWSGKDGVFKEGEVEMQSTLLDVGATLGIMNPVKMYWLIWSITRLLTHFWTVVPTSHLLQGERRLADVGGVLPHALPCHRKFGGMLAAVDGERPEAIQAFTG